METLLRDLRHAMAIERADFHDAGAIHTGRGRSPIVAWREVHATPMCVPREE